MNAQNSFLVHSERKQVDSRKRKAVAEVARKGLHDSENYPALTQLIRLSAMSAWFLYRKTSKPWCLGKE